MVPIRLWWISVQVATLGLVQPVNSFATNPRRCDHPSSRPGRIVRFSTTSRADQTDKAKHLESLKKLLERQQSETSETSRLIRRLEQTDDIPRHADGSVDNDDKDIAMASSLMAGFDYGFVSRSEGPTIVELQNVSPGFEGYGPPTNLLALGSQQFMRNLMAMIGEYRDEEDVVLSPKQKQMREQLDRLALNSTAIWERELADGPIEAPWVIKAPYLFLCYMLDVVFENRYVPHRFYLLETVARMPYFSYIGMLHLYETFGFWRRSVDVKRIHFAEELNEFRHLLIMESLGGDQTYWVRFMAQHSAMVYFIGLCFLWAISPTLSYRFSELLETHAVNTYAQFLDENEEALKKMPPSVAAVEYYCFGTSDPFYAEFQTTAMAEGKDLRRPGESMRSLYDTFAAICADEGDHVSTMQACLDPTESMRSPSIERKLIYGAAVAAIAATALSSVPFDSSFFGDNVLADGAVSTEGLSAVVEAGVVGLGQIIRESTEEGGVEGLLTNFLETGAGAPLLEIMPGPLSQFFTAMVEILSRVV
jgi:ubiquinol oxidase